MEDLWDDELFEEPRPVPKQSKPDRTTVHARPQAAPEVCPLTITASEA